MFYHYIFITTSQISELEREIMETYNVVFKSRESYCQILRSANLT